MDATPPEPPATPPPVDPLHPAAQPMFVLAPASLLAAVRLMYVGAGLSLLGMVYDLSTRDALRDRLADIDPEPTADELDRAVNLATGVSVMTGLISVGLWLWMAQTNGRGLLWARIVASVLFGLNVVLTIYDLTQTTGFGIVVDLVTIALSAATLWLLYRPDATQYYAARQPIPRR